MHFYVFIVLFPAKNHKPLSRPERGLFYDISLFFFTAVQCQRQMQLIQLLLIDSRRASGHQFGCILYLREGNDIADRIQTCQQHAQTIQTVCQAAVRRCTILERGQQMAKALLCNGKESGLC